MFLHDNIQVCLEHLFLTCGNLAYTHFFKLVLHTASVETQSMHEDSGQPANPPSESDQIADNF